METGLSVSLVMRGDYDYESFLNDLVLGAAGPDCKTQVRWHTTFHDNIILYYVMLEYAERYCEDNGIEEAKSFVMLRSAMQPVTPNMRALRKHRKMLWAYCQRQTSHIQMATFSLSSGFFYHPDCNPSPRHLARFMICNLIDVLTDFPWGDQSGGMNIPHRVFRALRHTPSLSQNAEMAEYQKQYLLSKLG